jgi:phage terminase large subunit-like protein
MSREDKLQLLKLLEEKERRKKTRKFFSYFPDDGPLKRSLYAKHMVFFKGGATKAERLFMAGNRVGKTESGGGYEATCHLTGLYPHWWEGKRFDRPISAWAAGDTNKTVKEILQFKLLGKWGEFGTGLIPQDLIVKTTSKLGVSEAVDTIYVKHASGGVSEISLKSYDQRREAFQGTEKDLIWLDEEPPLDIYTECLTRTMDTTGTGEKAGIMMLTFTPLQGMSETVMSFLEGGEIKEGENGSKLVVMAGWDDVPHLSKEAKEQLLKSIPPFQRDARSKGIPQLGAGAIYPIPESEFLVDPFEIPVHWPRAYGLDVGWNRTAAVWAARDLENDIVYLYAEHYRGQAEPAIHANDIRVKGEWIPGVIDPAANGRGQKDGLQLMQSYLDLGLDLETAFNGVESGIYEVWQRLSSGRLKVFRSMGNWLSEYRLYRRDEKGNVVKGFDHLMDANRYLIMSGLDRAKVKPVKKDNLQTISQGSGQYGFMG